MSQLLHAAYNDDNDATHDDDVDPKAIAIPQVFSENSQAKNMENKTNNLKNG